MTEYLKALAEPFPPEAVHWRIGAKGKENTAIALAYLDARDVMDRLDEVCGPAGWQCTYSHAAQKTVCELSINIDGEWVTKSNGAGDSDIEGEKGALSDAFKRAAVLWGIGRYLYSLKSPWVKLTQNGRSILQSEMPKLQRLLGTDPSNMPTANLKPLGRSKGRGDANPASPDEPPTPEGETADSPLESLKATAESDVEFREEVSHMIRGARDVIEVENIYRANKARLHDYAGRYAADHKCLMGEFERRKGDLSQQPNTEAA